MLSQNTLGLAIAAALLTGVLAGCGEGGGSEEEARSTEYTPAVVAAHMKDHFYRATEIQRAVINGSLESVAEPAAWMAEHPTSAAMPAAWESWIRPMRHAAVRAVEAPDLLSAARATAELAAACGGCHEALAKDVGFAVEAAPVEGAERVPHMQRHAWAAGRMWEGLVGPSSVVWDGGARILGEAPLSTDEFEADIEVLAEVAAIERRVHELGGEALEAVESEDRARLYGEFLATCARCHQATGAGPI
jgi:cytochrome c553